MEEKRISNDEVVHNIVLESRNFLSITGVEDVQNFDEEKIFLTTQLGELTIEGNNLHINKLSLETGEMTVEGEIDSVIYAGEDSSVSKQGFFARLFR